MQRPAKILLVGTSIATLGFAAGAANAQQAGTPNIEVSFGDVFAGQKLKVIDPADGIALTTAANAAAVEVEAQGQDARLDSYQQSRSVRARTTLNVHGWAPTIDATTAAVGNSAHAEVRNGDYSASSDQVVTGRVAARTRVKAQLSSSGDVTATAVAVGNDQYTGMEGGYADIRAGQSHYGRGTKARVDARLLDVQGSASMTASAAANQQGFYGSADGAWLHVDQTSTGETRATVVGTVESGQTVGATAAAAANTISLANKGPQADLRAVQTHEGYVRGEAYLTTHAFGEASVTAVAAGNTISADLEGAELTLDTDQVNSGGVEADAAVFGGNGYAMTLSASAIGNAVSGTVCAECDGALRATNSQVNNGDVSAGARADVGGAVRSTANAMGNSAVYVVKRPN
jgi:hypothetical protein